VSSHLPDFFLLGATKCGTTSLYFYLRQHPDLYLPKQKEPHVLNAPPDDFENELDDYLRLYSPSGDRLAADGTPSYFRDSDRVIPRIKQLYEERSPKFILIFRDPVERAFSHYLHKRQAGVVPDSFEEALKHEKRHPEKSREEWKSFFRDGIYVDTLQTWYEHFPEHRFHILLLDDVKQNAEGAVKDTFRFLGVDPSVEIDVQQRYNERRDIRSKWVRNLMRQPSDLVHSVATTLLPKKMRMQIRRTLHKWNQTDFEKTPVLSEKIAEQLREKYSESTYRLEEVIERDLSMWRP
jgi:hypothetical protein